MGKGSVLTGFDVTQFPVSSGYVAFERILADGHFCVYIRNRTTRMEYKKVNDTSLEGDGEDSEGSWAATSDYLYRSTNNRIYSASSFDLDG